MRIIERPKNFKFDHNDTKVMVRYSTSNYWNIAEMIDWAYREWFFLPCERREVEGDIYILLWVMAKANSFDAMFTTHHNPTSPVDCYSSLCVCDPDLKEHEVYLAFVNLDGTKKVIGQIKDKIGP